MKVKRISLCTCTVIWHIRSEQQ
uniref:Uncharacterized protein n=1 Tax=Arundo donax TaxID=35708 RepID=A0A0A9FSU0_ARUDO